MGLETATYISGLNPLNPVGATDPKSQGDDHLRLIKSVLQASFPNINGAVTATPTQINNAAGSGLTGFAAPSVKVKATGAAGAGAATTALRSDCQALLDLADAYAWTGQHSWTLSLRIANGAVGTPSIAFSGDLDTGFYTSGANIIATAVGGQQGPLFQQNGGVGQLAAQDGLIGFPGIAFAGDGDTGLYRVGSGNIRISCDNTAVAGFTATQIQPFVQVGANDGVVGTPIYSFNNDPDTGFYRSGADTIALASGGVFKQQWGPTVYTSRTQMQSQDGTAALPTYAFENDPNTGIYSRGADRLGFSEGGTAYDVGYRNIPQNSQSVNYTAVLADAGKHILHPNGGGAGDTFTIPANASVAYDIGTVITFVNRDSNAVSIAINTDTLILAGTTTTGTRTLAQNGIATAIKVEATTWIISGTALS